jgi:hypothetical protein
MFNFRAPTPKLVTQPSEVWQPWQIDDFSGGLNTAEPSASIRKDQQTALTNYYHQPNRTLVTRGPFRPWLVASEDTILPDSAPPLTFIIVELRGSDFRVASWDAGATDEVSVYDEGNDRWAGEGGGTPIKTGLTSGNKVRYVKYSINEAEDLIFANGKDTPQRWVGTIDTASTDLGLGVPVDGGINDTLTYNSHATANGGASTEITFNAGDTDNIEVNEHVLFTGVTGTNASLWNAAGGVAVTAKTATTLTFAIAYSAGTNFGAATITHQHYVLTTAAATAGGRGITLDGTYYYRFTNVWDDSGTSTKFGESGPNSVNTSIAVSGAAVATPQKVTIKVFHIDTGVDTIKIYRSPGDTPDGPFQLVGALTGENTEFVDVVPNGSEGVEITLDAGTPPAALKNPIAYDSRIWGIGINSSGELTNKGVYTRRGSPDFFPALNFIYFPDALAGPALFNKQIFWFTETQIWQTTDLDNPDTSTVKIADVGCDSWDSIVDVGNGLVWQFNGNIYWANFNAFNPQTGELPWPIGDPIRDKIDKTAGIPTAQRENSAGEFYIGRYYLSITGPNQTVNTATVVWDVKNGTRLLFAGITGAWSTVSWAANDLYVFDGTLYTADNTNKYLMEHDFAGSADFLNKTDFDASTSQNLATQYAGGDIFFGHEATEKLVNSLSIVAKSSGVTFDTTTSFNGNEFQRTKQFVLGSGSVATDNNWLVWGQGTWGNFNWGSTSFALQNAHKKIGKGGKGINAKLDIQTSNAQDTNLIALKIYHKQLPVPS